MCHKVIPPTFVVKCGTIILYHLNQVSPDYSDIKHKVHLDMFLIYS